MKKQKVSIKVDQSQLIAHLKNFFTDGYTFISELIQNGRRAGATRVSVEYNKRTGTITVTDNGGGVQDMQSLLTLAQSGWNDSVKSADKPFGMGFFAALFAAKHTVVESRGQRMVLDRDELVAGGTADVSPCPATEGTVIVLKGLSEEFDFSKFERTCGDAARGFTIPVFLNERELNSDRARRNLNGIDTKVGFMSIPGVHRPGSLSYAAGFVTYLQGLPIGGGAAHWEADKRTVVHLDGAGFTPRMPDRDVLVDADEAERKISKVIRDEVRKHILSEYEALSADEFALRWYEELGTWDLSGLLKTLPVPTTARNFCAFGRIDIGERQFFNKEAEFPQALVDAGLVHVEDVTSGRVKFAKSDRVDDTDETCMGWTAVVWADRMGYILVDHLPEDSWLWDHVLDLDACEVTEFFVNPKTGTFRGGWGYRSVVMCDEVRLGVTVDGKCLGEVSLTRDVFPGVLYDLTVCRNLGRGDLSFETALLMVNSFRTDESGDYTDSDEYSEECGKFADFLDVLDGEDPEKTLRKVLDRSDFGLKSNLEGQKFFVSFANDGSFEVKLAA